MWLTVKSKDSISLGFFEGFQFLGLDLDSNKFDGSYWWLCNVHLCEYAEMDYIIFLLEFIY